MNDIKIKLTPNERDLIVDHTFADDELIDRLKITEIKSNYIVVEYSVYDLDDLLGFIAAESNHTEDKKLEKKLDKLFDKLNRILISESKKLV